MWDKTKSKLSLAADMVRQAMAELTKQYQVILMFDSWYAKSDLVCVVNEFPNLDIICGARADSVLYDLPPQPKKKAGRPRKRGKRLNLDADFTLSKEKVDGYFIGMRLVLTNLFGNRRVNVYATSDKQEGAARRLFFSTIQPENLRMSCAWFANGPINQTCLEFMPYLPLFLYNIRWSIEVSYYEQKRFWSLCQYMVRSKKGIEWFVNLINVAYASMKLLPYLDVEFSAYQTKSVQELRFTISEQIREQIILTCFVNSLENGIKTNMVIDLLKQKVRSCGCAMQNL